MFAYPRIHTKEEKACCTDTAPHDLAGPSGGLGTVGKCVSGRAPHRLLWLKSRLIRAPMANAYSGWPECPTIPLGFVRPAPSYYRLRRSAPPPHAPPPANLLRSHRPKHADSIVAAQRSRAWLSTSTVIVTPGVTSVCPVQEQDCLPCRPLVSGRFLAGRLSAASARPCRAFFATPMPRPS
jgi:hypothetical protein